MGDVLSFRAAYLHGGNANPAAPLKWKLQAAAGGGVIADLASHVLDLMDWLIGPFRAVTAATQTAYQERPSPRIRKPCGRRTPKTACRPAAMQSGRRARSRPQSWPPAREDEFRLEIHGAAGRCGSTAWSRTRWWHDATAADEPLGGLRGWNRIDTGGRYPPPATRFPSPRRPPAGSEPRRLSGQFLRAVAQNRPAEPSLHQGIRVQHLMDCLRRSAAQGRWIEV